MATIKAKFRPSAVAGKEGTVYYQIIHERKVRQLPSDHHCKPEEWNERRAMPLAARNADEERRRYLQLARREIAADLERLVRIDRRLEGTGRDYTADDVVEEFGNYAAEFSLFSFMGRRVEQLKANGRIRTAETYITALNSFRHFRQGHDIMLDRLEAEHMEAYEAWLQGRGLVPNTVSFYTRILRAAYNRAVELGATDDRRPFRRVYTGIDKTVKRALPLASIRKINELNLHGLPPLELARDMFMLSFMLRGMSFIDMAFLRKSDLSHGRITYRRRKTGQLLTVGWTREMQAILAKYPPNASDYLLPIIRNRGINERSACRNASYNINHNLKRVARMAGVGIPLTLYVARHSWASAARAKGVPLSVISEGMGHDSEMTTQIYLASLDTSTVDRANAMIIRAL